MTNQISPNPVGIPQPVKIFTWVLIAAGLFIAYVFAFNPGLVIPGAVITAFSSQLGFAAGVRVFGSVVALLASVIYNKPQWLLVTLISRLAIELGDIVVSIATGGSLMSQISIAVIALFELWAIWRLVKIGQ